MAYEGLGVLIDHRNPCSAADPGCPKTDSEAACNHEGFCRVLGRDQNIAARIRRSACKIGLVTVADIGVGGVIHHEDRRRKANAYRPRKSSSRRNGQKVLSGICHHLDILFGLN